MQKKLIALAIAGLSSAAFAQSNVTVYGVADATFEHAKATGATATAVGAANAAQNMDGRQRITSNSSYIGFKGAEDLGNGLKAVFQIETQLALDNSQDASRGTVANSLANRDSFVGVAGGFGTVVVGYLSTPHRTLGAGWDVIPGATGVAGFNNLLGKINTGASLAANGTTGNTSAAANNINTIFRTQAVAYVSPNFAGFSGVLAYVPNEARVTNAANVTTYEQNTSAWNLGLDYANGPFKVGYSYLTQKDPLGNAPGGIFVNNTGGKLTSHLLAGSATFGAFTVGLAYNQNKIDLDAAAGAVGADGIKNRVWALNAKYVFGQNEIAAMYQVANDGSVDNTLGGTVNANDRGARAYGVRYGYNLSKRTQAYAVYSEIRNDRNGNYDFGAGAGVGNQQAFTAGADPKAFGLGLRHSF